MISVYIFIHKLYACVYNTGINVYINKEPNSLKLEFIKHS